MDHRRHNPIPKGVNTINRFPLLVFPSVSDVERINHISLRLGHLVTLCINSKAMNKHGSKKTGEQCQQHLAWFRAMANQAPDN